MNYEAKAQGAKFSFTSFISPEKQKEIEVFLTEKHQGSICVANYKGGVGKTTLVCLLGYYLAEKTGKKVLMLDIDAQCSLSFAVGFNPEKLDKPELTMYYLLRPSKWAKLYKTKLENYIVKVPDTLSPKNLYIIPGSFDVENLDMEIAKSSVSEGERRLNEFFLYCKQILNAFSNYAYVLIDSPPNKMYLTQGMLRACKYYLPVTIPDAISIYGMPRLMRWVKEIPKGDRPKMLGYVLNAINRAGGGRGGKVISQQLQENRLKMLINGELSKVEKSVIGKNPQIGIIPRLDAIARFLSERGGAKQARFLFKRKTSNQPTIDECLSGITQELLKRIGDYNAKS